MRVYDLLPLNRIFEWAGVGFYHTSIQIYDHEYYYGGHDSDITGIVETDIGKSTTLHLKEILLVGYTYYDADDISLLLDEFGKYWQGTLYDPFNHNWNDFTLSVIQHFCHEEGIYEFPSYINRFSKLSSVLRVWFKPLKSLFGDVVNAPDPSANQVNNDIEEGKANQNQIFAKDENFETWLTQAKAHLETARTWYILNQFENSKQASSLGLQSIRSYSNMIEEIKEVRLQILDNIVMCWVNMRNTEELIHYWTWCIEIDPKNPKYFTKRGLAFAYEQKRYFPALNDLSQAHELDKEDQFIMTEMNKIKKIIEGSPEGN